MLREIESLRWPLTKPSLALAARNGQALRPGVCLAEAAKDDDDFDDDDFDDDFEDDFDDDFDEEGDFDEENLDDDDDFGEGNAEEDAL